jgi:type I restriction enzyme S subunit
MTSKFGFTTKKVEDISEAIFSGGTPSTKNEKYWGGDIPWLSSGETRDRFINETEKTITQVGVDNSSTKIALKGDIVIASAGQGHTRGQTSYLNIDTYINQSIVAIRAKTDEVDSLWLFYNLTLRYNEMRQLSDSHSIRGSLTTSILKTLEITFPQLDIQKRMASTIYRLDKKIALNRQINQTLESMAQAIFKSWFVDFEPVKAKIAALKSGEDAEGITRAAMRTISGKTDDELDKMEGGQPEDYARLKTTAELFPAAMQDSELGEVPEGWEIKQLDQIAHYQNGLALQKFRPENEDEYLPVLKIAQLKKGFADGIEKASVNIKQECIVDDGDVVFSWSGSLMIDIWCGGKVALNQHLFKVTSEKYPKWFYYYWTKQHLSGFQRIAAAKAVTMGHIKREHLSSALCATSSSQIIENLSKIMDGLVEKSTEVRLENIMLQNLRDIILPKLLSGELSVDALELAEEN